MPHACVCSECMVSAALSASTREMPLRMRWVEVRCSFSHREKVPRRGG